jgi:hypothetical protein
MISFKKFEKFFDIISKFEMIFATSFTIGGIKIKRIKIRNVRTIIIDKNLEIRRLIFFELKKVVNIEKRNEKNKVKMIKVR